MLQDKFISTSELQQNVSKTIDRAKVEDIIIIRNNKLEAAIISIEKYDEFLNYLEWKKISDALDNSPIEETTKNEAKRVKKLLEMSKAEPHFTSDDIERMAESGERIDEL